jgi:hypothetical protein
VTTRTAKVGMFSRRMLAVAAVAAITMSLALTLRVALANDLHQDPGDTGIWWADAPQESGGSCDNLKPGEVLWHFVHTDTGASDLPSQLDANFKTAGDKTAAGFQNGNSNVFYEIITGEDFLMSASDDIVNDGNLNLSHTCGNVAEQSEAASVAESVAESEAASGEQSQKAGEGTPEGSQSDGAFSLNGSGALPTIAFSLILLASLGALAYANVKSVRNIS